MTPAELDTMLTAMVEAQRLTIGTGRAVTIFTEDQQLYRISVVITWVYPDLFSQFISRLDRIVWRNLQSYMYRNSLTAFHMYMLPFKMPYKLPLKGHWTFFSLLRYYRTS